MSKAIKQMRLRELPQNTRVSLVEQLDCRAHTHLREQTKQIEKQLENNINPIFSIFACLNAAANIGRKARENKSKPLDLLTKEMEVLTTSLYEIERICKHAYYGIFDRHIITEYIESTKKLRFLVKEKNDSVLLEELTEAEYGDGKKYKDEELVEVALYDESSEENQIEF